MARAQPIEEFKGTDRFEIERCLGVGSFGVVYRAYDRDRKIKVALKTLKKAYAGTLYRFKQEFRSLADVNHPNLVTLYELTNHEDRWFFTMELIEGVSFLKYLRRRKKKPLPSTLRVSSEEQSSLLLQASDGVVVHEMQEAIDDIDKPPCSVNIERVRDVLRQLVEGIHALHKAGKLHRDIKPSNVLVTRGGRVVLLDFGLVAELKSDEVHRNQNLVGTPEYMSPEQGSGSPVGEASDWYSVGVILFHSLTGQLPFEGKGVEALLAKQKYDPPRVSDYVSGVPQDLDDLCLRLMSRDASGRPKGSELLNMLGLMPADLLHAPAELSFDSELIGRRFHLNYLRNAYMRMKTRERPVTVYLHGQSGMGKTAVIQRFLEDLTKHEPDVLIFSSRCYDRETVPFKALDGLIDVMSRYLRRLPAEATKDLFTPSILSLAQLFPVLLQVRSIMELKDKEESVSDPRESRRLAFFALRRLITVLSERNPLVLAIDNLQWGDLDSLDLLAELLRPPRPPSILLIACYRSEDLSSSPFLQNLLPLRMDADPSVDVQELTIGELLPSEAKKLATSLLVGNESQIDEESRAEAIVQESGGNPMFIKEFVEFTRVRSDFESLFQQATQAVTLNTVIAARIDMLPPDARTLLEVVAVFGRPLTLEVAKKAAQIRDEYEAMAELRSRLLLRTHKSFNHVELETYNNRIRETVVDRLMPETRRSHHLRLGEALAPTCDDPELLLHHFQEGNHPEKTVEYATLAAQHAKDALAFHRAARLYRIAVEHKSDLEPDKWRMWLDLANSYANSGQSLNAAEAFCSASRLIEGLEALDLQRKGAEQYLRGGRIERALTLFREVFAELGESFPETPVAIYWSQLIQMMSRRLSGTRFRLQDEALISKKPLISIDTHWALSLLLGMMNPMMGKLMQGRHLRRAAKAGEPFRLMRALGLEAVYSQGESIRNWKRTARLLQITEVLVEEIDNPLALGWLKLASGMCAFLAGRYKQTVKHTQLADQIFREQCAGADWEKTIAIGHMLRALFFLGELKDMLSLWPDVMANVKTRHDHFGQTLLFAQNGVAAELIQDRPSRAETLLDETMERWEEPHFFTISFWELCGRCEIELYRGKGVAAWNRIDKQWSQEVRTPNMRIQFRRIELYYLRGRCALAAATMTEQRSRLLRVARDCARRLKAERSPWSIPMARAIQASVMKQKGEIEEAKGLLARAEIEFEALDMTLYATICKMRRGQLTAGDHGQFLLTSAETALYEQEVVDPSRFCDIHLPGNWERPDPS